MDIDAFGKRVRYLRMLAKLTQAQTAERLGITPEHLGNIERGVSVPSFELIYRIADVLNTEPFNLFLSAKSSSETCRVSQDNSWSSFLSGMGFWEYDMESGEMYWSESLFKLLGHSVKSVKPSIELMLERVHPDDLGRIREKWEALLKGNDIPPIKFRVCDGDGEYRTVINFGEVRKGRNAVVGFNVDITENCMLLDAFRELQEVVEEETAGRTRSLNDIILLLASAMEKKDAVQAELEDRETLFRGFVENIRDVFYVMEPGEGFTYVSPVCEDILGVSASKIIENVENFYAVVHPQDRGQVRAMHDRRLRGEQAHGVYRIIHRDGEVRRMRSRSFVLPGASAHGSVRIIGVTEDITDVHYAESAREKAEDLLERVLTAVGDAVCIVDPERRIVRASEGMARLFGHGKQLVGKTPEELMANCANVAGAEVFEVHAGELAVLEQTTPEGDTRILEVHEFPHFTDDGRQDGGVIVLRDVTEKHRAIRTLERACEEKSRFLAFLSHEIRTPLNGMLGLLQLLKMEQDLGEHEYVDAALASGSILTDLVNGVLDLSRLEAGRMEFREEPFGPRDLVQSVVTQFECLAAMKSLSVEQVYANPLPPRLVGDKKRIRQILSNLLANAIKFTDQGNVIVRAELLSDTGDSETGRGRNAGDGSAGVFRLMVCDTGEGIPRNKIDSIFDEYVQAGDSRTSNQGFGLGLAIIKRLLDAMGGEVQVESEPGKGSCFTCFIPVGRDS
ncbi:hypothetical protein DPQ33_07490 [Oceanidesulfovibrio indonesiensis]|uniref:histidine kinase n=2 Tax=Oceanidesulfovibrio indonesiensis TaxID=54767 RepID=A0A7M3MFQ6_9BACT|nr:hypothetical protein DPQ33_07490 [Oceanidesulfovibrio indonesiensis]